MAFFLGLALGFSIGFAVGAMVLFISRLLVHERRVRPPLTRRVDG